jgi:hypothetical protein
MDKDELTKWMKNHGIDQQLRVWVANDIVGLNDYTILEDLVTTGVSTISITLNPQSGQLSFAKNEPVKIVTPEPILPHVEVEPVETPSIKPRRKSKFEDT